MLCCASTWQCWRQSLERWLCEINLANRLAQACVHFVTDHNCSLSSCSPIQNVFQRTFQHDLPCHWTTPLLLRKVYPTLVIFRCLSRNTGFEHLLEFFHKYFIRFAFTLSASQVYMIKMMLVRPDQRISSISSTWESYYNSFLPFKVIYENRTEQTMFSVNKQAFPFRYFLPI